MRPLPPSLRPLPVVAAILLLTGCATMAPPSTAPAASAQSGQGSGKDADAASASAAAPSAAAPGAAANKGARPDPTAPKAFAEVIKDAQRSDGFIPFWRKDDKVWLEIAPERLGKPMLMSLSVTNGVGERGLYGNQMVGSQQAELRIVGRVLQILAKNTAFRATGDAPMARTVQQSFSDSLMAAAPVASAPHPDSKAVLVDASFLLADLPGLSTSLERAFRLPYGLDGKNSFIETVRGTPGSTSVTTQLHFATPRIPAPPAVPLPSSPRDGTPTTLWSGNTVCSAASR